MRKGVKLRRRRRIGQAVGGGAGLAAVVALGIFVTGINSSETVVVAPPATQASSPPAAAKPMTFAQMEEANDQLLLDTLGVGWGPGRTSSFRSVELDPKSKAADGLPEDVLVLARIQYWDPGTFNAILGNFEPYELPDGRIVQVERAGSGRSIGSKPEISTSGLYHRSDGSRVLVSVTMHDTKSNPQRLMKGEAFLDGYIDTVARLAANEDVRPRVGEKYVSQQGAPTQDGVHLHILQEALGDAWGTQIDGENRITLKPESDKAAQLPSKDYQGKATIQILSTSQFEAACGAKVGREACNWQKLEDGRVVHWRAWADRDSSDDTLRGELAAYFPRENGSVVMGLVSVLGRDVTAAERDAHRDATFTWLESLRHDLIAAVTDKRVGAAVFTTE